MINFQRFDPLREIGGVTTDVDDIANAQRRTRLELYGHDREVAVNSGSPRQSVALTKQVVPGGSVLLLRRRVHWSAPTLECRRGRLC